MALVALLKAHVALGRRQGKHQLGLEHIVGDENDVICNELVERDMVAIAGFAHARVVVHGEMGGVCLDLVFPLVQN